MAWPGVPTETLAVYPPPVMLFTRDSVKYVRLFSAGCLFVTVPGGALATGILTKFAEAAVAKARRMVDFMLGVVVKNTKLLKGPGVLLETVQRRGLLYQYPYSIWSKVRYQLSRAVSLDNETCGVLSAEC